MNLSIRKNAANSESALKLDDELDRIETGEVLDGINLLLSVALRRDRGFDFDLVERPADDMSIGAAVGQQRLSFYCRFPKYPYLRQDKRGICVI
jgi:hypothetical protein